MRRNQQNVAYNDLYRVCEHYFGKLDGHVAEPTRVVPLGPRRCAYSFTMFKAPELPDALFESQYESLRREFDNIRARFAHA